MEHTLGQWQAEILDTDDFDEESASLGALLTLLYCGLSFC